MFRQNIKTITILLFLFFATALLPKDPIDPWNLFSPKKIVYLIFTLALIQAMGIFFRNRLGARNGSILTGFLGGLISSTATTAALARKSLSKQADATTEAITFLAATLAMLFEAVMVTVFGTENFHFKLLIIFLGPILISILFIWQKSTKTVPQTLLINKVKLEMVPLIRLSIFILGILMLSRIMQNFFGQSGILILTFIVSLFEIHGSVIANLQLHDTGSINLQLLGGLLAISVLASYISKLFLVLTLGSAALKKAVMQATIYLLVSLALGWLLYLYLI